MRSSDGLHNFSTVTGDSCNPADWEEGVSPVTGPAPSSESQAELNAEYDAWLAKQADGDLSQLAALELITALCSSRVLRRRGNWSLAKLNRAAHILRESDDQRLRLQIKWGLLAATTKLVEGFASSHKPQGPTAAVIWKCDSIAEPVRRRPASRRLLCSGRPRRRSTRTSRGSPVRPSDNPHEHDLGGRETGLLWRSQ